jgi:hypothetical protein
LGGACIAAPFLGSIAGRGVRAQAAVPPKRLIMMFTHYGFITTRWFPGKSHGALTAADLEPTTLKHLAPFVDKLLMPRGIRAMNEWTADMSRGQGNDSHLQAVASLLTCQPVTPNSNDPFSFDQNVRFQGRPVGPSLDHVIAQQLSAGGTPLFIRVGQGNDSPQSAISYSASETPYPGLGTPQQVFSTLTGLFTGGSMNPDTYRVARGKGVLDVVKDDLATLERFDMSRSDRMKLAAWKELLNQTGGTIATAQCNPDGAASLGATQENIDAAGPGTVGADRLTREITDTLDGADIYSSVAALAAVCNANPMILLKYPATWVYRGLGLQTEHDSLAHRIGNASSTGTCVAGIIDMLLTIDDYHARKFAHLVGLLDSIDEGDGKVLDNSAAVWLSEFSDGCARNLNNMPIVQVGSVGGYFKTGRAVNVEDGSADLTAGNSEIVCADGTPNTVNAINQATGTDPALANAPINKYYCSLMNALGVKAGADGFAAKGGTAEVTKFGMYDRTQDFIGGGTIPPLISDPGEYTALKA